MDTVAEVTTVTLDNGFWGAVARRNYEKTVPCCLKRCEETGRIENFASVTAVPPGKHQGRFYNDACLYKVLEGVANTLAVFPDAQLERYADSIIEKVAAAQQPDGYLCTYFQLEEPGKQWTDMCMHEMYGAGHLLEAGLAYLEATGKDRLYRVAVAFVEHIMERFGPGKEIWVPGHQEIELALIKLFRHTGTQKYLEFAHWLIEQRGHGHSRGREYAEGFYDLKYNQDDRPFIQQRVVTGHAVRAMYLYIAATDYLRQTGEQQYLTPLLAIWENIVEKNMYITGGIGSTKFNEGFTADYDLPNKTAYNETCASVGMVMWNHRLTLLLRDARYFDVAERTLFNGVLSGIGLDGETFFYDNVLESDGDKNRSPWFTTSCCPTQLSRFLPVVKDYFYMQAANTLCLNLYGDSRVTVRWGDLPVELVQQSGYPYDGRVKLTLHCTQPVQGKLCLRIPGWCEGYGLQTSFGMEQTVLERGYLMLERSWQDGDNLELTLDMPVKVNRAHPCVAENKGKVALTRGPLVYCLEEMDNPDYDHATAGVQTAFCVQPTSIQETETQSVCWTAANGSSYKAVPYHLWNNRGQARMKVWFDEEQY